MKILIFTLFITSFAIAQDVNWKELNSEMEYLKKNAFVDQPDEDNTAQPPTETEPKPVQKVYSLKRKPKVKKNQDPNVLDLENQFFDEVKFKYSAPKRNRPTQDSAPKSKEEIRDSITTPELSGLEF